MYLITGSSGYFGNILKQVLSSQSLPYKTLDILPTSGSDAVEHFLGDIRNVSDLNRACQNIHTVFHCAAQVPIAKNRKLFDSVNIEGTKNLMKASLACGVKHVVYLSSSAVYGVPEKNPVTELSPTKPIEHYGRSKLLGEEICQSFSATGIGVSVIRPRTILGPGRLGIFQILFDWVKNGFNIPILGNGANAYQFVDGRDLAKACIVVAQKSLSGIFNCGATEFGTMLEMLETLCRHAKTGSRVIGMPKTLAKVAMKGASQLHLIPLADYHYLMYGESFFFDNNKSIETFGWAPKYSNNQMIIDAYDWYLSNINQIKFNRGKSHTSALSQGLLKLIRQII